MIVNRDNFPKFLDNKLEFLSKNRIFDLIDKTSFLTENYFFCSVIPNHGLNISIKDYFSSEYVQKIISEPNTFLLMSTEFESMTDIVDIIYRDLISTGIVDADKIVVLSENVDLPTYIEKIATSLNLKKINKVHWITQFELSVSVSMRKHIREISNIVYGKKVNKSFLCFNRRWRIHRPLFIALLKINDLLDKGLVSFGKSDDNLTWDNVFDDMISCVKTDDELYKLITQNEEVIKNIPYMYLDTTDLVQELVSPIPATVELGKTIDAFESTYFSVITETNFFDSIGRFITEKTFKCFGYKHPFIIIGTEHTLPLLHTKGYKTFHPFIDESYDQEADPLKRLKMILSEVKRLSNLNDNDRAEFIKNISPIIEHNFKTVITKQLKDHIIDLG